LRKGSLCGVSACENFLA